MNEPATCFAIITGLAVCFAVLVPLIGSIYTRRTLPHFNPSLRRSSM